METSMTEKLYEALNNYSEASRFRELVAEILYGKVLEEENKDEEIKKEVISEDTLVNKSQELKKIIAASKKLATATGDTEFQEEEPFVIASQADETVERVKQAYLYKKGEIDYEDMAGRLIDFAEAKLVVLAENAIDMADTVLPQVMEKVSWLRPAIPLVKKVLPVIKPVVKTVVKAGIKAIATVAKKIVPKVFSTFKKIGTKIKEGLKILLS